MKKRYALLVLTFYCLSMLVPMIAAPSALAAASGSINAVASEMAGVYSYLDYSEKTIILAVRATLLTFGRLPNDRAWNPIVEPLLTPQVVAKFGGDKVKARRELIKFAAGMGAIRFSDDSDKLASSITNFKNGFKDDFFILFGKDVSLEQMCQMLLYTKAVLPQAADASDNVDSLLFGTDKQFLSAMREVEVTAMQMNLSGNPAFEAKMAAIGWTPEKLVNQQAKLANRVDPTHLAELALGKAAMRSLTTLYQVNSNGTVINQYSGRDISIPVTKGNSIYLKIKIMDRDITKLVLWRNINLIAVSMNDGYDKGKTLKITAKNPGTATIVGFRDFRGSSIDDWLIKFRVYVPKK